MKILKIDKTEYKVSAMPEFLDSISEMYREAYNKSLDPKASIEEREKQSANMQRYIEKILEKTVSPKPSIGHYDKLYAHVLQETIQKRNEVAELIQFFRNQQEVPAQTEENGATGDLATEKTF